MEDLVLTIEQCEHLQKLGLDMSDAKLAYILYLGEYESIELNLDKNELKEFNHDYDFIPTYTLQEILEKLPYKIIIGTLYEDLTINIDLFNGSITYSSINGNEVKFHSGNKINLCYGALCWIIENGYLKDK